MNYIKRNIEKQILSASTQFPVVVVTGPRQVGKTTVLQHIAKDSKRTYISLDDLKLRQMANSDPQLFLQNYKLPILIDEIQYAPQLFSYIKQIVDKRQKMGDFWITGSQKFNLMRGVQESLAGRAAILSLNSLTLNEIDNLKGTTFLPTKDYIEKVVPTKKKIGVKQVYENIFYGSMPSYISGRVKDINLLYESYVNTYLLRDVHEIEKSIDALVFYNFLTSVAARCGQLLNISSIAKEVGINEKQVKLWLNILETLGIIFYLHPLSNNLLKRLIKTPKIYFFDLGLVCYLTRWINPEAAEAGAMNGALFETYVISEIYKNYEASGTRYEFNYYRDKDGKEIDLIINQNGCLYPLEIKKSSNPTTKDISNFRILKKTNYDIKSGALIDMYPEAIQIDEKNFTIPAWAI